MTRSICALSFLVVTMVQACNNAPGINKMRQREEYTITPARSKGQRLTISVVPDQADMVLRIGLRNGSSDKIWINSRLSLNVLGGQVELGNLQMDVLDSNGQPVPFSCTISPRLPKAEDYVVLDPG